ncbi:hypothetical protein [Methylocystis heyeri]|uniref:Uncharacterized protein n=1 Tax=Methylocystis heyeri TaxID=391905 RepID=A0A6B8KI08_9HYPH|nr:hypothetical protein [Methylocystis heyeri]QGM46130.1 hypothetical protein H2LOC_010725 [Methylocystis heyeri]
MIVYNNPIFDQAVIDESQAHFARETDMSMVRVDPVRGVTLGGALYTEYNGHSVQMHVAGLAPNWLNRKLLRQAFEFPFEHLKVKKIFGLVEAANTIALDFDLHLGFIEEARIGDVFTSGDMVVLAMYRHNCRFLPK